MQVTLQSLQTKSAPGRAKKSAEGLPGLGRFDLKSSGENWRGERAEHLLQTRRRRDLAGLTGHTLVQTPLSWTKGGCRSLCPRGTRPNRRAARPAASSALPCSPAPPVSRHQSLSVQSGGRPPARRRHFQFFPGCTRTTHNTNKRQAAPAPSSLPQPPTLAAPAHAPPRRQHAPPPPGHAQAHSA